MSVVAVVRASHTTAKHCIRLCDTVASLLLGIDMLRWQHEAKCFCKIKNFTSFPRGILRLSHDRCALHCEWTGCEVRSVLYREYMPKIFFVNIRPSWSSTFGFTACRFPVWARIAWYAFSAKDIKYVKQITSSVFCHTYTGVIISIISNLGCLKSTLVLSVHHSCFCETFWTKAVRCDNLLSHPPWFNVRLWVMLG